MHDFVFGLGADGFGELLSEVEKRKCVGLLGASDFDALAERLGRKPKCQHCGSSDVYRDGFDKSGRKRFRCGCGHRFGLLSGTALSSAKTSLPQWLSMVKLMSFNVLLADVTLRRKDVKRKRADARRVIRRKNAKKGRELGATAPNSG